MKKLLVLLCIFPLFGFSQCVLGDCNNGTGTSIIESDEYTWIYSGEWKNGTPHGWGTEIMYDKNGIDMGSHVGNWENGIPNSWGVEVVLDDNGDPTLGTFVGEWKDGSEDGWGVLIWGKKDIEVGVWKEGELIE